MDISQQKVILRQESLRLRKDKLSILEDNKIADLLFRFLILSPEQSSVVLYLSTAMEVPTIELADALAKARPDLRLFAPRTLSSVNKGSQMEMYPLPSHKGSVNWSALTTNAWGILEPLPSEEDVHLSTSTFSCILVPALMLDVKGHRLGYGGGYYDRYLARQTSDPLLLSPCRSYAFTDRLPHESFDTAVHYIFQADSVWEANPYSGELSSEQKLFLRKNLPAKE